MIQNKRFFHILWGIGLVLLVVSGTILASPKRLVWEPRILNPASIAPGETQTFEVTLRNLGPGTVKTEHFVAQVTGDAAEIVSIDKSKLPEKLKKGEAVAMQLTVSVPTDAPMSIVSGSIILTKQEDEDKGERGKEKEEKEEREEKKHKKLFLSNSLPLSLILSSIPLPPDPGEAGKQDLLGIDVDNNGVRDDIDIYIAFAHPDSEKIREALKQGARAFQLYLQDADDQAKTVENWKVQEKGLDCLAYVFDHDLDVRDSADSLLRSQFFNTEQRSDAYVRSNTQVGTSGYVSDSGPSSERFERRRAACSFDADAFPN